MDKSRVAYLSEPSAHYWVDWAKKWLAARFGASA